MSAARLPEQVTIGGTTKAHLLHDLRVAGVALNELANQLFQDSRFATEPTRRQLAIVPITVQALGFSHGATWAELTESASVIGLSSSPLELAAHLRLCYVEQEESSVEQPASRNRAPDGSITVVSEAVSTDDEDPKGFYLRKIDGVLWLRAYRSWPGHVWGAGDVLLFSQAPTA